MCFPVGDPDIQTSCSLRGRLEYTLLGLDGYWSMVSNGKLFKWLMHHILNIHFSENISTVYPCIHWPVVRKWTNLCRTSQNKKHFNGTPAQPILMAAMLVKVLTLCCWNLLNICFMAVLLTIRHGLHQNWTFNYKLYLREIKWQLVLWLKRFLKD